MERKDSITEEVRAILRSPSFQRSPSLTSILKFLLSSDLGGEKPPTQYDIAREALGKSEDFNETVDSSVRVQISRLRKALSDYYLTHQPTDGLYVYIRVGEYRLRTARLEIAYPDIATAKSIEWNANDEGRSQPVEVSSLSSTSDAGSNDSATKTVRSPLSDVKSEFPQRPIIIALAIAGFFALLLLAPSLPLTSEATTAASTRPAIASVPYVSLDVNTLGRADLTGGRNALVERVEAQAREVLLKSLVSRLDTTADRNAASYNLSITLDPQGANMVGLSIVLADETNRVISQHSIPDYVSAERVVEVTEDELIRIVSPAGDITRHIAKELGMEPQSDFECFIAIESVRIKGANVDALLERCLERFPDGSYSPYLHVRKAFASLQSKSLSGETINRSGPEWSLVAKILGEHPENPYANTLAAKMLISRGECADALSFARNALSKGRTFPALELSVIVDAYGCRGMESRREDWDDRIARISDSNREPHDLLESLIIIGALITQQEQLVDGFESAFSSVDTGSPLGEFNLALLAAASGKASTGDFMLIEEMLPAFLFNDESRGLFMERLRDIRDAGV